MGSPEFPGILRHFLGEGFLRHVRPRQATDIYNFEELSPLDFEFSPVDFPFSPGCKEIAPKSEENSPISGRRITRRILSCLRLSWFSRSQFGGSPNLYPDVLQSGLRSVKFLIWAWRIIGYLPTNFSANSSANSCRECVGLVSPGLLASPPPPKKKLTGGTNKSRFRGMMKLTCWAAASDGSRER